MKLLPALIFALAVTLPAAETRADEAADRKAEIQRKKEEAKKRAEEKRAQADEAKKAEDARKKAEEEAATKAEEARKKAQEAQKCSPTCTPTCDCSGNPITPAKCSPTCTPTCDCSGNPIAAAKCSPTCTPTCDCSGNAIKPAKCSPTCTPTCDCSGNPIAAAKCSPTCTPTCDCSGNPIEIKKATDPKKLATPVTQNVADEKDAPLPSADIAALRQDRGERRRSSVERLRRRWGSVLAQDQGAAELKNHSRRVAFLQRIRIVADKKKDTKTVEQVDELITAEDQRHSRAMNALREGALSR
jgi:hypothetical protein